MNNATSESAIVTKSMPPSRKLIATNGAMAANNVVSLTACAISLPTTTRRDDNAVSVMRSNVCSTRSRRRALKAPSGTTTRPRNPRQAMRAMNVQRPAVPPPATASVAPRNATISPRPGTRRTTG
jgi:hypothetical protein